MGLVAVRGHVFSPRPPARMRTASTRRVFSPAWSRARGFNPPYWYTSVADLGLDVVESGSRVLG